MGLFVDIPKPRAWPPPPSEDTEAVQKLIAYGYERDPLGDKFHTAFACLFMFCLPLASHPTSWAWWILFVYSLMRLPTTCRTLSPLCKYVMYWSILAWVLWSTLSIAWSSDKTMGLDHARSMWEMALVPILLWPVLRKWKWFIAAGLLGVFLQNMFQLSEIVVSWFLEGNDWISIMKNRFRDESEQIATLLSRPIGLDNHEGNGSLFMAFAGLVWLGILVGKRKHFRLAVFGFLFAVFGVVVAESRAVGVGFTLALFVLIILAVRNRLIALKKVAFFGTALLGILIASACIPGSVILNRFPDITQSTTRYVSNGEVKSGVQLRLHWAATSLKQSFDSPAIIHGVAGHGLGSTKTIDFSVDGQPVLKHSDHPHNAYVQNLYEGGVIGLALFMLMLWKIAVPRSWQSIPLSTIVGFACVVLWAITSFFDGGQNSGRVLALLMLTAVFTMFYNCFQLGNGVKIGTKTR